MKEQNANPCPYCRKLHEAGEYTERMTDEHDMEPTKRNVLSPPDVQCDCGALLRYSVPLFKITANGWLWRRIDKPAPVQRFTISATNGEGIELEHTKQTVAGEDKAKAIVYARNKAEPVYFNGQQNTRKTVWGYYPAV